MVTSILSAPKPRAVPKTLSRRQRADDKMEGRVEDVTIEWLYRPHTLSAVAIILLCLVYWGYESSEDWVENLRHGIGLSCIFLLVVGLLVFPSGPFIRPHPLVWRFFFGVGIIYEIFLIIVLVSRKEDARQGLRLLYPDLGVPLEEKDYGANCALTWPNISDALFDRFVVAHFLGWVLKTTILRDRMLCWAISISWELTEVMFMHHLPNFGECWWDQWILDVLLSNGLGIEIGYRLCRYFEMRPYEWRSALEIPSTAGKLKRLVMQFSPATWMHVRWQPTKSIKRFFQLHLVVLFFLIDELNAFYLKALLWIPPDNSLNIVRLAIWFFVGLPAWRQVYLYMTDPDVHRIGNQTFICMILLLTELLIIIKFSEGEFTKPMSENVRILGWVLLVAYVVWSVAVVAYILHKSPASPPRKVLRKKKSLHKKSLRRSDADSADPAAASTRRVRAASDVSGTELSAAESAAEFSGDSDDDQPTSRLRLRRRQ